MGNASTTDRKYKSTNSFDKKKSQGLTASSLGRHTSPNFNTKINKIKSKTDNRKRESSNNLSYRSSDINFNVFKDIFPVPSDQKTRNTMTPLIRVKTFKNDFMQKLSADFDRDIAFSSKDDNRQVYQENRISIHLNLQGIKKRFKYILRQNRMKIVRIPRNVYVMSLN